MLGGRGMGLQRHGKSEFIGVKSVMTLNFLCVICGKEDS